MAHEFPEIQTNEPLAQRVATIRDSIDEAADAAGRDPRGITLMAVTKTRTPDEVRAAVAAGITVLGENRVQEARGKMPELDVSADWHMIGPLQTNKVNHALALFDMVQTVDRLKLARALNDGIGRRVDREEDPEGRRLDVLVEVNTSGEDSKHGVPPDRALELLQQVSEFPRLRLRGLMTVGLLSSDESAVRAGFARLRKLRDEARDAVSGCTLDVLSMGMTSDYEWAIAEGSTIVRLGTAIFGPRAR